MHKVAAIQMCSKKTVDENLKIAAHLISEAAKNQVKLCVLPEMFAIMSDNASDKIAVKEEYSQGKIQNFLSEQAKKNNIWIVGGTIPIACHQPNKVKAACLVFNSLGKIVARYDKINLFDVTLSPTEAYKESDTTEPGDQITLLDTPFGKLALAVCYDIRFTQLFYDLRKRGAEIIVIPAAFTVPTGKAHWQLLARARAVDTFCYVIGAAQGGTHENGRQTYGHSLIVDPWGTIAAEAPQSGDHIIYADIDLEKMKNIRRKIPVFN
ncbi:MAG: acyltransferase [Gammaproteobacteria bacterium RIFCSPHIGHO2_02_FULL_39_13]|nr:MAG: acyltransferase [Gammaproteobacteria bacterium RIFCSPHIGHO2_02_FULL_39_13]OGT49888.1 MAG: acyltransferase [Gammaproteobacteria bacterium RIFCSPHIGHO2_12_FULL_39_24]